MNIPPIDWFRDPQLDGPTPVTVTPDGRVYGHIAAWDTPHVGMPGKNVRPPRSRSDYGYFHVGSTQALDAGEVRDISVGHLTLDTGHASLTSDANAAAEHYDNTGAQVATVCAGEDAYGIWFAGAVDPGVDELRLRKLRASAVSGDWRPVDGSLELVAALMVSTPGFPIPRARVASAATADQAPVALVAAGIVPNPVQEDVPMASTETAIKKGDLVELVASGALAQVTDTTDEGFAVELLVTGDEVKPASPEKALAASAAQQTRTQLRSLTATVEQLQAEVETQRRIEKARELTADIEV